MESVSGAGGRRGALWSRVGRAGLDAGVPDSPLPRWAPRPRPCRPGVRNSLGERAVSLEPRAPVVLASSFFRSLHESGVVSPDCRELRDPVLCNCLLQFLARTSKRLYCIQQGFIPLISSRIEVSVKEGIQEATVSLG